MDMIDVFFGWVVSRPGVNGCQHGELEHVQLSVVFE